MFGKFCTKLRELSIAQESDGDLTPAQKESDGESTSAQKTVFSQLDYHLEQVLGAVIPTSVLNLVREYAEDLFPVLTCPTCNTVFAGFRCRGTRPPTVQKTYTVMDYGCKGDPTPETAHVQLPVPTSGCEKLMYFDSANSRLVCPEGHGTIQYHCQCDLKKKENTRTPLTLLPGSKQLSSTDLILVKESVERLAPVPGEDATSRDQSPLMTCTVCGLSVDGYCCVHLDALCDKSEESEELVLGFGRIGFYERVWCAWVWGHCNVRLTGKSFTCGCVLDKQKASCCVDKEKNPIDMETLAYTEEHFRPAN